MQEIHNLVTTLRTHVHPYTLELSIACQGSLTYYSNDQLPRGAVDTGEEGVVHDGVLLEKLCVSYNGLHQDVLGVGVHIHWVLADNCREGGRERGRERGEREREREGGREEERERESLKHYSCEYNKSLTVEVVSVQEDVSTAVLARVNVATSHRAL